MPRHRSQNPQRRKARALAFATLQNRAQDQLGLCEIAFNDAVASAAEMLLLIDDPQLATAHLSLLTELRLLARRLQRRLESF
jgi:hypothetical protein